VERANIPLGNRTNTTTLDETDTLIHFILPAMVVGRQSFVLSHNRRRIMTYAVVKTLAKRTRYFNVEGKTEVWHPIDVTAELVSLHEDVTEAHVVCQTNLLQQSPSGRTQTITFPLGEDDDERHVGTVTTEITSYQVVEMKPGTILSHLDDLEALLETEKE
jgi:hypothetical protein